MDSLRQTVAKVALSNMGFIPLVGSILHLSRPFSKGLLRWRKTQKP